jgi:drug/metabolite transporter (DMT)-like permease
MPLSALLFALLAILLWSFLALLGASLAHLPALLVTGAALTLGGLLSAFRLKKWRVPLVTLAVGVGGMFGYHFFYFTALRYAPPVEASLMNYLWPLLIVLLAPLYLPHMRLRIHHAAGAVLGLLGAALILSGGRLSLDRAYLAGYASATLAAFIWASYSLLTRRVPPFPGEAVGAFCFTAGLVALGVFFLTPGAAAELPALKARDAVFLLLLGVGPLGVAFFAWDAALKNGDPRIIGSLAYLTPLFSTLNLVLFGGQNLTLVSGLAMALIICGALLGSMDLFIAPKTPAP